MRSHAIKALIADNIKQIHPRHLKSNMFYKIWRFYKFYITLKIYSYTVLVASDNFPKITSIY
jgi:hypothetical protein